MISTSFDESKHYLSRPKDMTEEQCDPLSVAIATMDEQPVVISCWKLTKEELEEFQKTGRIWLIICGNTMPPVALTANNPFLEQKDETLDT
jgi:hypothetical protein